MAIALSPQEHTVQQVILHGVSWETYERLLADFAESHAAHFAYDQGVLEIHVPSAKHEEANRTMALLIEMLALELDVSVRNLGSPTFKREDLAWGCEPDTCFYIQSAQRIHGKDEIDLAVDPPPDLVIVIDITHPSLDKLPIYAAIGVPEIWRYDGHAVTLVILQDGAYVAREESIAFPRLTREVLSRFMAESKQQERTAWLRSVRAWVHQMSVSRE
jgi:Uma2 family endonuclease